MKKGSKKEREGWQNEWMKEGRKERRKIVWNKRREKVRKEAITKEKEMLTGCENKRKKEKNGNTDVKKKGKL